MASKVFGIVVGIILVIAVALTVYFLSGSKDRCDTVGVSKYQSQESQKPWGFLDLFYKNPIDKF